MSATGATGDAPLFSVLLPTHDRPGVLGCSLRSILAQTCGDFELLLVGDGVADETREVVAGFADPRIRFFDLSKGPGFGYANRNVALRQAEGELVAFAADDDLMLPDHLGRFEALLRDERIQWAYSRPLWVNDEGAILPVYIDLTAPSALRRFMHYENFLPAGTVVHRRACLERYGYWPEEVESAADYELWKAIIRGAGAHTVGFVREPTHLHFRALWKPTEKTERWAPVPVTYLEALAERHRQWPAGLRLDLAGTSPPQARALELLEADPEGFQQELRSAVVRLGDELAFAATCDEAFV